MSKLEQQLKRIVHQHPETNLHPHSPSGPYVRAVMWTANDDRILGQTFWDTETTRWVVRAFDVAYGEGSLVVEHPHGMTELSAAITRVIDRIRHPELDKVAPALAELLRSLRTGT
ncbi:hypothetical protein ACFW31_24655 [Nocardiopsis alba]|uniref:hypothetical protein n=1 Tax=Nocardiopsis alba TaxID=53437 RepID=UPI00366EC226